MPTLPLCATIYTADLQGMCCLVEGCAGMSLLSFQQTQDAQMSMFESASSLFKFASGALLIVPVLALHASLVAVQAFCDSPDSPDCR